MLSEGIQADEVSGKPSYSMLFLAPESRFGWRRGYSSVIKACVQKGELDLAGYWLERMAAAGLQANEAMVSRP